jgi:hypothetical protein
MPYRDPEKAKAYSREYSKNKRANWTDEDRANWAAYVLRRRVQRKEGRKDPEVEFFDNGNKEGGMVVERAGLRRLRRDVPSAVHHLLTDRQREVHGNRVHMSRGWIRMEKIMKETGMTMQEFVAQLSVEELVKGRFRDKDGNMRGRPPKFVPREFQQACLRELMTRGQELWLGHYVEAIKAMTAIASGDGPLGAIATPSERLKAAQFVVERIEGKVPERLVVSQEQPWKVALDGIVADVPDEAIERGQRKLSGTQVVEGETVEDDEEPTPAPARSRRRRTR